MGDNQSIVDHCEPMMLGASFMHKCLDIFLNQEDLRFGPHKVQCRDLSPLEDGQLEKLLHSTVHQDRPGRILVHLDEHWKMCKRETSKYAENGAEFSRGAMEALAMVPKVTVIATYTRRPPLPPLITNFQEDLISNITTAVRENATVNYKVLQYSVALRHSPSPPPHHRGCHYFLLY